MTEPHTGFQDNYWYVHKFGGTSVASAQCYRDVAAIVRGQLGGSTVPKHLALVVSAMGGKPKTTDLLLNAVSHAADRNQMKLEECLALVFDKHRTCLAELFGNDGASSLLKNIKSDLDDIRDILKTVSLMKWQADRIKELVSGYGELWSAQILCQLLQRVSKDQDDHFFTYLDARRVITVDEEAIQNGAIVWDVSQDKLEQIYREEQVKLPDKTFHFVITGYVASNTEGVATTLQRDGSDYSAAILGRLLQANEVNIWTDVDGIMSADPRRVPLSQVLSEVSYNEAMELAYFGAKVIHPKTMQPAILTQPHQIPIYIKNTFNPSFRGTRIFQTGTSHTDKVVAGLSSVDNMALINVEGSGLIGVPGVDRRIFGVVERMGVNCVLISQGSSEHSVTFALAEGEAPGAVAALTEEFSRELKANHITNIDLNAPCSIIAAVGDGMALTTGVSGRFFSALGEAKINIHAIAQGSSERNISAVVSARDSTRALRAVHAAFRLSHTTVRVAIVGMNELGESLLKLLEQQRHVIRNDFEVDLQICVIVPKCDTDELVVLKNESEACSDSITIGPYSKLTGGEGLVGAVADFGNERDTVKYASGTVDNLLSHLIRNECTNHVIFDCTASDRAGQLHAMWLRAGVDVVTANNTGVSGPKLQRDDIRRAAKLHGKDSAHYMDEVTVGGGLPFVRTLRTLLHSGDKIRRVEGILSVSWSFILFRICPPREASSCSDFDEQYSKGAFRGDLSMSPNESEIDQPVPFSVALKEAMALGLMEEDPTKDLNNEFTSRILMVLAQELGLGKNLDYHVIQTESDKLFDVAATTDFMSAEIDEVIAKRMEAVRAKGCVLRQISSVDVKSREVQIKLVEVPDRHLYATTPPSCECLRFFTERHKRYPLIIQGPSAGEDSTASALLAELLQRMRSKASPVSVALSRSGSHATLAGRRGSRGGSWGSNLQLIQE